MYSRWQLGLNYLRYYLTASNGKGHGTHSPFIFEFITTILHNNRHYPQYDEVELLRQQLLQDNSFLVVEDLGAGSAVSKSGQRRVSSVARHAAKPKKYGQLLFRMARHFQPKTILELGTSLGITTSYLSLGNPASTIYTIEGAGAVADRANLNFDKLNLKNIALIHGNFDDKFPALLGDLKDVDLAFIDGNHQQEPTEKYFNQLLPKTNNDSILVFDDIHWSGEMEQAWETIKAHSRVRCSIDLFFIGIVFFREEFREKQAFKIRF